MTQTSTANLETVLRQATQLLEDWKDVSTDGGIGSVYKNFTLIQKTIKVLNELNDVLGKSGEDANILKHALPLINALKNKTDHSELDSSNKSSLMGTVLGFFNKTEDTHAKKELNSYMQDINQNQNQNQNQNREYQYSDSSYQHQLPQQPQQPQQQQYQYQSNQNVPYQNKNQQSYQHEQYQSNQPNQSYQSYQSNQPNQSYQTSQSAQSIPHQNQNLPYDQNQSLHNQSQPYQSQSHQSQSYQDPNQQQQYQNPNQQQQYQIPNQQQQYQNPNQQQYQNQQYRN